MDAARSCIDAGILPLKCGIYSIFTRVFFTHMFHALDHTDMNFLPRGRGFVASLMQTSCQIDVDLLPQRCGLLCRKDVGFFSQ